MSLRARRRRSKRHLQVVARLVIVLGILAGTSGVELAVPHRADAFNVCSFDPDPITRSLCNKTPLKGVNIPGLPDPTSIIKDVGKALLGPLLQQLAQYEADAVVKTLSNEADYINKGSTPQLTAQWFKTQYAVVFGIAVLIAIFLLYGQTAAGVFHQEPGEVVAAWVKFVAFILIGGVLPLFVAAIVKVVDGPITAGYLAQGTTAANSSLSKIEDSLTNHLDVVRAVLLPIVILFFGLIGGVLSALLLALREGALYLFTASEVISLALWVGNRWTGKAFTQNTMALIGMILLKPILALILNIGLGMLGANQGDPVIYGALVCLLIPFVGYAAYKRIAHHDIQPGKQAQRLMNGIRSGITALAAA
jgi:hypothetical protein